MAGKRIVAVRKEEKMEERRVIMATARFQCCVRN
jgi:hypothetical protein